MFLIGTLIGFVFFLPVIMRMNFVWFPDIYGWLNPVTHSTAYWGTLRPQNVMPAIYQSAVGLTQLTYNPMYVALALFIPLHTLLSASFFYIVYILIGTQIAYTMGYYSGIVTASDGTRSTMLRNQPPINVTVFSEHGILLATLVMAVLLNFKHSIIRPLRVALGKESFDLERKEPTSYRTALIIILISSTIIVGMLAISGFTIDDAIIFFGMALLMQLALARIRGLSGAVPVGAAVGPVFYRWKYPNVTMDNVPRSFFLYGLLYYHVTSLTVAFENSPPIFENWRVNAALGVDNRSIFKVMCITAVISTFIALTTFVSFGSIVGHSNTPRGGYWGLYDGGATAIPSYIYVTPVKPAWPWILAGALLAIALSFMHQRFVWWPLDPVGAFLATGGPGVKIGLGWVFIIAFVIKYAVMKVGGTKTYSDVVAPIAIGFVAGSVLSTVLGAILGIITFLRPI